MALDPTKTGDKIAVFIQSNKFPPGTLETADHLKLIWEGIMNIVYTDIKSDAEILPGTFKVTDDDSWDAEHGGVVFEEPVVGTGKVQ